MTDEELRALVRDAIARHLGGVAAPQGSALPGAPWGSSAGVLPDPASHRHHASHGLFVLQSAGDGACLIEPAVACTHCGYCKSYGH